MRRILVTGANKGIGLAIATAILEEHDDTFVLLGARSPERGQAAIAALIEEHPAWAERLALAEIDVASDTSVETAAAAVRDAYGAEPPPLYAVVNNAGVGRSAGALSDVVEVNTRGVRRVCEAFLPLLDPHAGRIVNITSASGPSFVSECSPERQRWFVSPDVTLDEIEALLTECIELDRTGGDFAAAGLGDGDSYGISKACTNSYTMLLARNHPQLRINACTPGFIETDLTRPYLASSGKSAAEMGMKAPADGARSAMFLLFGEPEGNGRYYGSDAQRSPLDRYRAPGAPPYTGA